MNRSLSNIKIAHVSLEKEVFVIAEISANHAGNIENAKKLILEAKKAGADAVKLQTYTAHMMTFKSHKKIKTSLWAGENLWDLYDKSHTPLSWHKKLFDLAKSIDIPMFSSPFSTQAVEFLEQFNPCAYKIASFEIGDLELIKSCAKAQKPVIISTGVANYDDIKRAIQTIKNEGNHQIVVLKCCSAYPAPIEEQNLLNMAQIQKDFDVHVGFSDHTIGNTASITAVGLGACVIEKHFKLQNVKSADDVFSANTQALTSFVRNIKEAKKSLGTKSYNLGKAAQAHNAFRRSLFFAKDLKAGQTVSADELVCWRPNLGLCCSKKKAIIGKVLVQAVQKNDPVTWAVFKKRVHKNNLNKN